jgi:hypothetical protein
MLGRHSKNYNSNLTLTAEATVFEEFKQEQEKEEMLQQQQLNLQLMGQIANLLDNLKESDIGEMAELNGLTKINAES